MIPVATVGDLALRLTPGVRVSGSGQCGQRRVRRVFISYRRQETAWPARQLHDVLAAELGADRIFKDVDDIEPGDDFVEQIQSAVGSCQVLLALIGPQWLTVTDAKGARRIDDPADFVRLEVETALSRDDVRVIPILVDHAKMPTAEELPAGLAALTRRQAVEINPVSFDTHRLLRVLNETLNAAADAPAAPRIVRERPRYPASRGTTCRTSGRIPDGGCNDQCATLCASHTS